MLSARHIFFVGIKGVAMANLAIIARELQKTVSGSDTVEHFITDNLLGDISVLTSFKSEDLPKDVDLVVYSAAHGGLTNPQVIEAKSRGIQVLHQVEFINTVISSYQYCIGVAGCHGKTTTTSLLAYALIRLGKQPGYLAGVSAFTGFQAGSAGKKNIFVLEADEYGMSPPEDLRPKFLQLELDAAIITNIDFDHPDVFKNIQETEDIFYRFAQCIMHNNDQNKPSLFLCIDDEKVARLTQKLPREKYVTYGFNTNADFNISEWQGTTAGSSFKLVYQNKSFVFETNLWGRANIQNATAVISMLVLMGFTFQEIQQAIEGFSGAKRRFEMIAHIQGSYIIDDYAHHPHEIQATIEAARMRFPSQKIVVIFQPHTYSRTFALKSEFIQSLSLADQAFILPIFGSAREGHQEKQYSSEKLVQEANEAGYSHIKFLPRINKEDNMLQMHIHQGDVLVTMGAGNVYEGIPTLKDIIYSRYAETRNTQTT